MLLSNQVLIAASFGPQAYGLIVWVLVLARAGSAGSGMDRLRCSPGSTIASNSLIGMGAIVLNGARIGQSCLVGAGALITEGKAFADNSLIVGAPARAVRSLDDKAREEIARGADIYVRRWQHYAKALKRIG